MFRSQCPKNGERRSTTGGEGTFKIFGAVDLEGESWEANSDGSLPDVGGAVTK